MTHDELRDAWKEATGYAAGTRAAYEAAGGVLGAPPELMHLWFAALDARWEAFQALMQSYDHREAEQDA